MARTRNFKRSAPCILSLLLLCPALLRGATAQESTGVVAVDSDHDGISDSAEQALLIQFAPKFMVGRHDCSRLPAEFKSDLKIPTVKVQDGTIYGQVFPAESAGGGLPAAEIHFYHLWASDCGPHSHPLDAEHVAVLVSASDPGGTKWKAIYWYAAAHEKTVCDVSQITRAITLHAEESGARVFVSPDKHASYLNEKLCRSGCGADRCVDMVALPAGRIINLGEAAAPMNGSIFIASVAWPLLDKMTQTNFPIEPVARLKQMPDTDIAWFNPGKHPSQGIIANSNVTKQAIAGGARNTTNSLSKAEIAAGAAMSVAQDNTGNALHKSYKNTVHALGASARHVGEALSPRSGTKKPQ